MPRQRTHHSRRTYDFPVDFPERLERFREASSMTWAELGRRLGTHPHTMRRWRNEGVRPSARHMLALLSLADSLGLDHILKSGDRRPYATGPDTGPPAVDAAS